jgi:hypothetical protein
MTAGNRQGGNTVLSVLPMLPGVAVAAVAGGATSRLYRDGVAPATSHHRGDRAERLRRLLLIPGLTLASNRIRGNP